MKQLKTSRKILILGSFLILSWMTFPDKSWGDSNLTEILGNHYTINTSQDNNMAVVINVNKLPNSVDTIKKLSFAATQKLFHDNNRIKMLSFEWRAAESNSKTLVNLNISDYKSYLDGDINFDELLQSRTKINSGFIRNERALDFTDLTNKPFEEIEYAILKLSKNPYAVTGSPLPVEEVLPKVIDALQDTRLLSTIVKKYIHSDFEVEDMYGSVVVTVYTKPDMSEKALINKSFQMMLAIIQDYENTLTKIDIIWTAEKGDFGKKMSLPSIYIEDYKQGHVSKGKLKNLISIDTLEPYSRKLNQVAKIELQDVSIENMRKAKELREAAYVYMQQKDYESAVRTYTKAHTLNPNDKLSYYWLGKILRDQRKPELAKQYLEKSLAIDPEFRAADEELSKLKIQFNTKH